jgi:hypothetical protein
MLFKDCGIIPNLLEISFLVNPLSTNSLTQTDKNYRQTDIFCNFVEI